MFSSSIRISLVAAFLLASFFAVSVVADCKDQAVLSAFANVDKYAKQEQLLAPGPIAEQQDKNGIKEINSIVQGLSHPEQLVELISMCKGKIAEIPSDSKHEPYFDFFESVIHFSIHQLGSMNTAEAKRALDDVHPIITGSASLIESWNEAKEKQCLWCIARIQTILTKYNIPGITVWKSDLDKVTKLPSSPRYQPYWEHEKAVIADIIHELGFRSTPEAKKILIEIHPIITGMKSLSAEWDQSKSKQNKAKPEQK
jgi:hypothetical protein